MTEEEKKAIEVLEKYKFLEREEYLENNAKKIGKKYEDLYLERTWIPTTYERKQFTIVYNLIEKLKKEIEEYKLLNANIEKANRIIEGKEEYIPKDKIKEKIKELEQQKDLFFEKTIIQGRIDLLKELLEEE